MKPSSKELYRCGLFWVTEDRALDPHGFEIKRSVIRHSGSAVVIPIDDGGRILLIRQYRLPAGKMLWELPAGKLDPGESPLTAAKRELIEETGLRARRWRKLSAFYPTPGFVAEKMNLYEATGLTQGPRDLQDDERITKRWFAAEQVERMIRSGRIDDAKTIIGFYLTRPARTGKPSTAASR